MPQMSSLMWLILFGVFSLVFLISMIKVYFNYNNKNSASHLTFSPNMKTSNFLWKW